MYRLLRIVGHQEWIRFGIRNRFIRYFARPKETKSWVFDVDFYGLRYKGDIKRLIDWQVFFFGAYEKPELQAIRELLMDINEPICLDIGANVGHHTMFLSIYSEKVYAFEPFKEVIERLNYNININKIENVYIHEIGLGNKNEIRKFSITNDCNDGSGQFIKEASLNANNDCIDLKIFNGDEYISQLALDDINFIKIDVEGFEKFVLLGLEKTLRLYRPIVMFEYSQDTKKTFRDLNELRELLPDNYDIYKIETYIPFLYFFSKRLYNFAKFDFNNSDISVLLIPSN